MTLDPAFLHRPIAHRGYHMAGRPENGMAAFRAAISAGYGIELDLQLSADAQAMVFHDETLDRLTAETGRTRDRTAAELSQIALSGTQDRIPTLAQLLSEVAGRVPLLIELKDQTGAFGPETGALEQATAQALHGYDGPVAVMSFNPYSVERLQDLVPDIPRGITTCAYDDPEFTGLPATRQDHLRSFAGVGAAGCSFVSHDVTDLHNPNLTQIKAQGHAILCWTVRSPQIEAQARKIADNITFEGYAAPLSP